MSGIGVRYGFQQLVDGNLERFLAHIDTAFLATADREYQPYVQHRGGPKGFIKALDEHTLAFADFAGNRQYITVDTLKDNDKVLLFLIDYERKRRVKLWGHAKTVDATPELVARLATPGYKARIERVVLITVTAWDVNCPAHIPQKLDATEVASVVEALKERIATLESELASARVQAVQTVAPRT
jgi:predicted pyridoxine 5'-phosphate oxidase superfamily flavin-nucleotide-binding protein